MFLGCRMSLRFARAAILAASAWAALAGIALASSDATIVSRVEPDFPREAVAAGASSGRVKARMSIDASGEVTRVEIVEANPHRVFDRAVIHSLSQWRFNT